jgi:hypothetical protein
VHAIPLSPKNPVQRRYFNYMWGVGTEFQPDNGAVPDGVVPAFSVGLFVVDPELYFFRNAAKNALAILVK